MSKIERAIITNIEGVVNNGVKYPDSLSKHRLRNLSFLVKNSKSKLILNGDWRLSGAKRSTLTRTLRFRGIKVKSSTPSIEGAQMGSNELQWIKENNPQSFVILTSDPLMLETELAPYVVVTSPKDGLTEKEVMKCFEILGVKENEITRASD